MLRSQLEVKRISLSELLEQKHSVIVPRGCGLQTLHRFGLLSGYSENLHLLVTFVILTDKSDTASRRRVKMRSF